MFSARCSTVTSASRDWDQPGRPRTPNAGAKSSSCSHSPSRSRTVTASGGSVFRDPYIDRIAAATTGSGSGHGAGYIDMTRPFCSRDEGDNNGRSRIMATITHRIENLARRAANKPPGSAQRRDRPPADRLHPLASTATSTSSTPPPTPPSAPRTPTIPAPTPGPGKPTRSSTPTAPATRPC
jgi:hypothetical protein